MIRTITNERQSIYERLAEADEENAAKNMPNILPPMDEWCDWDVVDGKLVRTKPNIEFRCLKVSKEENDKLLSLLKSLDHGNK